MEIWPFARPRGYVPARTYSTRENGVSNPYYSVLEHRLQIIEKNNESLPASVRRKIFMLKYIMGMGMMRERSARKYIAGKKTIGSIDGLLDQTKLKGLFVSPNGYVYLDTADIKIGTSP